ncbi:hypothetical protein PENTCL1PPCAC_28645, partial [Pristionchus entomophagus]
LASGGLLGVQSLLEGLVAGHLALTLSQLLEVVLLTLVTLLQVVLVGLELGYAGVELLDLLLEVVGQETGDVDATADGGQEDLLGLLLLFLAHAGALL